MLKVQKMCTYRLNSRLADSEQIREGEQERWNQKVENELSDFPSLCQSVFKKILRSGLLISKLDNTHFVYFTGSGENEAVDNLQETTL